MTLKATYTLEIDWDGDGVFEVAADVSDDLMEAYIDRGCNDPLARVGRVGTASLLLRNASQAYSPPLEANVRPQRAVKLTMTYGGTSAAIYRGRIATIAPTFGTKRERRVTFYCADDQERLDRFEGPIALLENTTADAIIEDAVEAVYTPDSTSYQAGITRFPFASDRWDTATRTIVQGHMTGGSGLTASAGEKIQAASLSDWGRFFIAKDGTPTFVNRHDMPLDTATDLTLDDTMVEMTYQMSVTSVYNHVSVTCHPRAISASYEVLGRISQTSAPTIDAGATETFTLHFRDPSNPALRVGGKNVIAPVEGLDLIATSDEPGEGADVSSDISVSLTIYGDHTEVSLENTGAAVAYIQKLQVRGRAVRVRESVTVVAQDATSIAAYGRRELAVDATLMSTQVQAQALADYLLAYYKDPLHDVRGVEFFANRNAAFMAAARDLDLGDRVALTESQTGLSAQPLHVYAIRHTIMPGRIHRVSVDLEQAYDYGADPWTWDTSTWDDGDVWIY